VHSNPVEIEVLPGEGGGDSSADRAKREAEARLARLGGFGRRISFIGLDLTDAPRRSSRAELPDLFEERPTGSGSYVLRDDVVAGRHPEFWEDGVVYYAANKEQFYIIKEPGHPGSGSKTFYGPFEGEPWNRFGMAEPRPAEKEYHLAIYLVVDPIVVGHQFGADQPDEAATLEQLRLAAAPLFTEEDIVEYDWNEHSLKLTPEAWKRLPAVRSVWGLPFVIVADGERCYLGAFWSSGSSYMPKVPFIGGFRPGWRENKIQILPPEPIAGTKDPRDDPRIRKVLETLGIGKLSHVEEPGKMDVETILAKVRQAQRPARNMRIEWVRETDLAHYWSYRRPKKDRPAKEPVIEKSSVVISGKRSRIERREEYYEGEVTGRPLRVRYMTSVFDGSEQRRLNESGEGYERKRKRGYIEPEERNTSLFVQLLFGSNPLQHGKEHLERYKFELELLDNELPGIYVLRITEPEGHLYDLITIDGNRGYNIVRRELFRSSDDVKLLGDDYELKRYPNGIWFLSKRENVRYTSGLDVLAESRLEEKVTVRSVRFDTPEPEEERFKLEFPPGTTVRVPGGEIVVGEDAEEELREVIESGEKLKGLGKALSIYANDDEEGRFPDALEQLLEGDYVSDKDLEWLVENVEYMGKGKTAADAHDSPIAYDKTYLQWGKGTNILYLDGHVAFRSMEELEKSPGIQPTAMLRLIELKERQESGRRLRGLGKALSIYAHEDEEGRFPDTLQQLLEGDYVSKEALEWLVENVEYLGKAKKATDALDTAIAYDKTLLQKSKGTNILYLDGHVAFRAANEEEVDRKTSRERKRIEGLIDQLHRAKAILAYAEQMQSASNLEEKVAEYKRRLAQIAKDPPYDPDETLPEELEKSKQIYGDDWKHIHSQLRSTVGTLILSELLDDTEFEPFVRFMTMYSNAITIIPIEHRDSFALSSGINPYHEPDAFWKAYKEHLKQVSVDFGAKSRLTKLKEQFDVPNEIIDTIRTEMIKGWQMYGYRFFIGVLSPSDKGLQQTQKQLDSIEQKLNKYPNWEKIEEEMFQRTLFPANGSLSSK
jgi:prepilin-type processing-associated H-X9-DG protein